MLRIELSDDQMRELKESLDKKDLHGKNQSWRENNLPTPLQAGLGLRLKLSME